MPRAKLPKAPGRILPPEPNMKKPKLLIVKQDGISKPGNFFSNYAESEVKKLMTKNKKDEPRGKHTLSPQGKVNRKLDGLTRKKSTLEHRAYIQEVHAATVKEKHPVEYAIWAKKHPGRAEHLKMK